MNRARRHPPTQSTLRLVLGVGARTRVINLKTLYRYGSLTGSTYQFFFSSIFFHHPFYSAAQLIELLPSNDLLDKPWSHVSSLLPLPGTCIHFYRT